MTVLATWLPEAALAGSKQHWLAGSSNAIRR
jgi:hypothetical protein